MLQSLEINNFTIFEEANLEFSAGLNIIVGENGTGKSHLLKLGYVFLLTEHNNSGESLRLETLSSNLIQTIGEVFRSEIPWNLCNRNHKEESIDVQATFGQDASMSFRLSAKDEKYSAAFNPFPLNLLKPTFIPAREILSHFTGFAAALRNRELAFDKTFLDLADALALTPLKGKKAEQIKSITTSLEQQMNGRVVVENERFYIATNQERLEMPLVAEGIRKIAMLTYLIMNGSIQKGSTLFWDEPESNLNPKMMVQLAETLVTLSSMGIQIVIASHSLFLLRELEIQLARNPEVPIRYFALKPEKNGVLVSQGDKIEEVDPITALDADLEQSERYLELE
jgi:predicted ATPase